MLINLKHYTVSKFFRYGFGECDGGGESVLFDVDVDVVSGNFLYVRRK